MYRAAVEAHPRSWNELEDDFVRAMEGFDANVASGLADIGDLQNGKGDFFNDVLALLLENCAGLTLYSRGGVPGFVFANHNLDLTYPNTGVVRFTLAAHRGRDCANWRRLGVEGYPVEEIRAYGGGVLKMETREAERLRIPAIDRNAVSLLENRFAEIDQLIRNRDLAKASEIVDTILGVDHETVWSAYLGFRTRRLGRRRAVISKEPVGLAIAQR